MNHTPEFPATAAAPSSPDRQEAARDLAACYARLFLGSADGRRVLADLRRKFGVARLVFHRTESGVFDPLAAALLEGERRVLSEIETALAASAPSPVSPQNSTH